MLVVCDCAIVVASEVAESSIHVVFGRDVFSAVVVLDSEIFVDIVFGAEECVIFSEVVVVG